MIFTVTITGILLYSLTILQYLHIVSTHVNILFAEPFGIPAMSIYFLLKMYKKLSRTVREKMAQRFDGLLSSQ